MRFWLRSFLWSLLSRPIIRAVAWTDEEAKHFESFCKSSCGVKFCELLRQTVAGMTFTAVYCDTVSASVANARARGAQDLLALIHRLRSSPPGEADIRDADEDVEPLPSQRGAIDGRRFGLSGGNSAIG
jgi:hypothetical protein